MSYIYLDIETAAAPDLLEMIPPADQMDYKSNTKDPEKIKLQQEEKWHGLIEKAPLHWSTGRIVCICLRTSTATLTFTDDDEKELLESFTTFGYFAPGEAHTIVTYNGHRFDIPFIMWRLLKHGLPVPAQFRPASKYKHPFYLDLYQVRTNYGEHRSPLGDKMEDFCYEMGIPMLDDSGITGADVPGKWAEYQAAAYPEVAHDAMEAIINHCKADVEALQQLHERIMDIV